MKNPGGSFLKNAAFLIGFFAATNCRSLRGVTFCANRKSPKSRTGRGCFDSPSPCEPSPATTEVGLRSPFWNPLGMVQCLALPTAFSAKISRALKMAQVSRSFAIPWRESKGNRARFLFGGSRVGFQKGRGKRNPRPFCDSLHTFCSYRKYAHGVTSSRSLQNNYTERHSIEESPAVKRYFISTFFKPCSKMMFINSLRER